jgi:hypothetical protein
MPRTPCGNKGNRCGQEGPRTTVEPVQAPCFVQPILNPAQAAKNPAKSARRPLVRGGRLADPKEPARAPCS